MVRRSRRVRSSGACARHLSFRCAATPRFYHMAAKKAAKRALAEWTKGIARAGIAISAGKASLASATVGRAKRGKMSSESASK